MAEEEKSAGLYDELDQAGLWVDDRNGSYVVKHK